MAGGVSVRVYPPPPELQPWLTFTYLAESAGPLTDFLYPEWGNVRLALAGDFSVAVPGSPVDRSLTAALYGPTDRHSVVVTDGGLSIGFGFTPLCWSRLIGGDASDLANRAVPLGDRLGVPAEQLRRQLIADVVVDETLAVARLERLVAARLARTPPISRSILAVDAALRTRPATIGELAARAGVTERTLHRMCRCSFGFSPKRLLRLQRFLDAFGHARSAVGDRVGESLGPTYCDQSHFYRDFRDFMAMSPRDYFSAPRPLMAAAAEAQRRAGVTLSFRLPPPPG